LTEPESRHTEEYVGEGKKMVGKGDDEQRMKELLRELSAGLRNIK
jgi:hypothetical protein